MKKLAIALALLILSAPLFLTSKVTSSFRFARGYRHITELVKDYLECGPDCPQKFKDAIVRQIASLRNINTRQAVRVIIILFAAWQLKKYATRKRPLLIGDPSTVVIPTH